MEKDYKPNIHAYHPPQKLNRRGITPGKISKSCI